MSAIEKFKELATEERFKGWPLTGAAEIGPKIPFFGSAFNYKLKTGNGVEDYTSILRHFGWAVVLGIANLQDNVYPNTTFDRHMVTLVQCKLGVNRASWELPPGGIGKISPTANHRRNHENDQTSLLERNRFRRRRL